MGQLGVSVALDHPSSDSIFALAVHAQFYFALFVKSKFRRKKKYTSFSLSFFSLSFSSFSLRFTVAWPILPPSKMHWKRAICRFPLLMYFQKTLQSDINCFDCMHLFVITHCCPTLLPVFFFSSSNNLALYSNICVQSAQRESAEKPSCHQGPKSRDVLKSFQCREHISYLSGDFLCTDGTYPYHIIEISSSPDSFHCNLGWL